jgi:hypothetical protein
MASQNAPRPNVRPDLQRGHRFAWVAARLHSVSRPFFEEFTREQLGSPIQYEQAWKATGRLQAPSRWRGRQGRPRANPSSPTEARPAPALWDWVLVDEPALGLLRVLYRLPNDGLPRPALLEAVAALRGVRQIIEVANDREILAIALVENLEEADRLRARIQDHAIDQPVRMDLLSHETHEPARLTWIELARTQLRLDERRDH